MLQLTSSLTVKTVIAVVTNGGSN